jgi:hypothetical protein
MLVRDVFKKYHLFRVCAAGASLLLATLLDSGYGIKFNNNRAVNAATAENLPILKYPDLK